MSAQVAGVFDVSSVPPPGGSTDFSLQGWDEYRNRGIDPKWHSGFGANDEDRQAFLHGAALYGLRWDPTAPLDAHNTVKPQQLAIVDTLSSGHDSYVLEVPRRASKTTTLLCLMLGRCARRPGYQVTFSAQSGVAGSRRLREWKTRLDLVNPPDDQDVRPSLRGKRRAAPTRHLALFGEELVPDIGGTRRGFRVLMGEVGKGIYFENGSQMLVLKPDASAVRGEAADVTWLDEAQEIDPDDGDDLLAGLLPLMDTKPGAHLIVSGTCGEARVGPFWKYLSRLRAGDADVGGMDFAVDEDTPWEHIEDEETAMRLVASVHPGIGTLTTLEKMRKNWRGMPKPQWAREYLSLWPETFGERAIDETLWNERGRASKPARPARVAFGVSIKPGGASAAICAAWRTQKGVAYVEVIAHQSGTKWLPKRMQELTQTYRGSTVAFDDIGEGKATATECEALSPKPRLKMQTFRETAAGCVQFLRDLERDSLRHSHQVGLDAAVAAAARREVRGDSGVWLWTPAEPGADITPLDAATRALRNWDQHHARPTHGARKPIMGS